MGTSADHTTIAAGHASGSIFTWELASPARPFLSIPPLVRSSLSNNRRGDGHVEGCAVLHVGFLGQRHTALVSADDHGMAFSHLATRGLGAVARNVKTVRVLGRYPEPSGSSEQRKPSSVLGFASLPLGNIESLTDDVGLTAILTPYLLVVVSTTPIAQTQFKLPRAKDVDAHSAMTGCLAWFPAVKMATSTSNSKVKTFKSKLVYCWSTMLYVLDVEEIKPPQDEPEKGPTFIFKPRSQWRSEEAIVAVQWLSRSVLGILTVSQRLVILEDQVMRLADSSDLNAKHIYHQDLYSQRLKAVVDKHEEGENVMHGVIPDAFHMSFKAYKGRLFLLGMGDVLMGALSNWADRLQALLDRREYLTAIKLANMYYAGETEKVTIGLLEDDTVRHSMVGKKLLEIMSAALQYTFNDDSDDNEKTFESSIQHLVEAMFSSCLMIDEKDFLFDTVYEYYSDASRQETFLYTLEPYILNHDIDLVPPEVMKDLLTWYASNDLGSRLEEIICSLQPFTMDIDQVTNICKAFELYDALAYVWTQALGDFITPLIELLKLMRSAVSGSVSQIAEQERADTAAAKLFPYLAYTLTGRRYPDGLEISDQDAIKAKAAVYGFIFSYNAVQWPQRHGKLIRICSDEEDELPYPYLQILLHSDTQDFLSMLNEAFEDSFLNGGNDQIVDGIAAIEVRKEAFGQIVNRQRITNILLEVMRSFDFGTEKRLYLDIFVARNLSKFAQFILLPGTVIRQVLTELCKGGEYGLSDECQLSVEYVLSVYHPPDIQDLISLFVEARFFRILKSVYKSSKQYGKWLETHFDDPNNKESVFTAMAECLRPSLLNQKQLKDTKDIIIEHAQDLAEIDTPRTVACLQSYARDLLKPVFDQLRERPHLQYAFLEHIYEPSVGQRTRVVDQLADKHIELYVRLMCQYNPNHVADYVSLLKSGDLHLNHVLPAMEVSGVIDAAVILLARDGLVQTALSRLIKHLSTLETAVAGLLSNAREDDSIVSGNNTGEAVADLLEQTQKYVKLGIWLCQGQGHTSKSMPPPRRKAPPPREITEEDLLQDELLWLDFLDMVIGFSRTISTHAEQDQDVNNDSTTVSQATKASDALRLLVQQAFTALLASTSSVTGTTQKSRKSTQPASTQSSSDAAPNTSTPTRSRASRPSQQPPNSHAFLRILRMLLTRLASQTNNASPSSTSTLSSLRSILSQIFSAYTFESSLLDIASGFLNKDVFLHVEEAFNARRRGWTPRSMMCEICAKKAWGKGLGVDVWDMWNHKKGDQEKKWGQRWNVELNSKVEESDLETDKPGARLRYDSVSGRRTPSKQEKGKGKNRDVTPDVSVDIHSVEAQEDSSSQEDPAADALVVFACGHMCHRMCLEKVMEEKDAGDKHEQHHDEHGRRKYKCPICHA